jgi:hypothetical protein
MILATLAFLLFVVWAAILIEFGVRLARWGDE